MRSSGLVSGLRALFRSVTGPGGPEIPVPQADAVPCTMCGYCMPCPYGVDIMGVFSAVGAASGPDGRDFLAAYSRDVPYLRQANHCIGCGICVSQCPQSIDIPAEMRRIDAFAESLKEREFAR